MRIIVLILGCLAIAAGCNKEPTEREAPEDRSGIVSALSRHDTSGRANMYLFTPKASFHVGDTVVIGYVVKAGRQPVPFYAEPQFFHIRLYKPSGELLTQPGAVAAYFGSAGDAPRVLIPANGLYGQMLNLTCGRPGLGPTSNDFCIWKYDLRDPGRYSVVMTYAPEPHGRDTSYAYPSLESDTLRITIGS